MTTKPTLVLCPGTGWSGTTPLYYTLAIDHQYCHAGNLKESLYLSNIPSKLFQQKWFQMRLRCDPKYDHFQKNPKLLEYCKHTKEEYTTYSSLPFTFDKYINYNLQHYNYLKDTPYQALADFSITNADLNKDYLAEIAPKLKEHFDVKVLIIYRDPVRRMFSRCNTIYYYEGKGGDPAYDKFSKAYEKPIIRAKYKSLTAYFLDTKFASYIDIYRKYTEHFQTLPIVMEQFFDVNNNQKELERLSDFLGYTFTKSHQNCYVPDMGPNAPKYPYLKDQWESDREELAPEVISISRKKNAFVYDEWQQEFGSLPPSWIPA